jgi:DNA-binding NtrC family response regulator
MSVVSILLIGYDLPFQKHISELLAHEGYVTTEYLDDNHIPPFTNHKKFDLCIIDHKYNGKNGWHWLEKYKIVVAHIPLLIISNSFKVETAVDAMKKGAFDYFTKPLDVNKFLISIRAALKSNTNNNHDISHKHILSPKIIPTINIIGNSPAIKQIKNTLHKVAPTEARILITGENGVGKELVAKWIHENSLRKKGPLIEVNCAAIPSELIESELFGHEKGAFTSAVKQHIGKFEQANGGTLFLDEIGDMSPSAQAKVLRVLQEGKITRVGGDKSINTNVRIITATNKDLLNEVNNNHFRLDLYHRLSVVLINVPSLNERIEDIPHLVKHFLTQIADEYQQAEKKIDGNAIAALQQHHWTGNIRELRNVMERLFILSGSSITVDDVNLFVTPTFRLMKL